MKNYDAITMEHVQNMNALKFYTEAVGTEATCIAIDGAGAKTTLEAAKAGMSITKANCWKVSAMYAGRYSKELFAKLVETQDGGIGMAYWNYAVWNREAFATVVEEKNFYHSLAKMYGEAAIPMMENGSLLGASYAACMQHCLKKHQEIWLPDAESIFEVLRVKLERLEKWGFHIPAWVHEEFMDNWEVA